MNESTLYTLTVPMRDSSNRAMPEATQLAEHDLALIAGGWSATIIEGGWVNGEGLTVRDSSTRFDVIVPSGSKAFHAQGEIKNLAKNICVMLAQDCVLVTRQDHRGFFSEFVSA